MVGYARRRTLEDACHGSGVGSRSTPIRRRTSVLHPPYVKNPCYASHFRQLGHFFPVPDNWQLDEEELRSGQRRSRFSVLAGHSGRSPCIRRRPRRPEWPRPPWTPCGKNTRAWKAEPVNETVAGHALVGFDLNFFYLDLTNTACIRSLRVGGTTYTIFFQAEDREYPAKSARFSRP